MSSLLAAQAVRDIWAALLTSGDDATAVAALERIRRTASPRDAAVIDELTRAVRAEDRGNEARLWRQLECGAGAGYPSETPLYQWRYDPRSGAPLTRYQSLD